jgi:DNA-binding Xre family transcriptional regulator
MSTQALIVTELKRVLRERGYTYAAVAKHLQLSEASVKRLFSTGDFTLQRVDQICELLALELPVILEQAQDRRAPTNQLSLSQEKEIISDPGLFLIAWLTLSRTPFEAMVATYKFSAAEVQHYLIKLDRLKVLELQPGNRVRLLVSRRFSWRRGGPVQRYISQKLLKEFFADHFAGENEEFFFHGDVISKQGLVKLKRAVQHAVRECMEITERDRGSPDQFGVAFAMALRPWEYSGFVELRRDQAKPGPVKSGLAKPGAVR